MLHGHVSTVAQNGQTGSREGLLHFYVEVAAWMVEKDWLIISIFIWNNHGYSRSPGHEVIYIGVWSVNILLKYLNVKKIY